MKRAACLQLSQSVLNDPVTYTFTDSQKDNFPRKTFRMRILTPETDRHNSKLSNDTVKMIEDFFQDDANSRVTHGKKDALSVKAGTDLKEKK